MTTQNLKGPQTKANGQKLSKKDIERIQMEEAQKQASNEISMQINEWARNTAYPEAGFIQIHLRAALRHFSDLILKMPYHEYKELASVVDGIYTYNQINMAMQLLSMVNCEQLGYAEINTYIAFKDNLMEFQATFIQSLDSHRERIANEYTAALNATAQA